MKSTQETTTGNIQSGNGSKTTLYENAGRLYKCVLCPYCEHLVAPPGVPVKETMVQFSTCPGCGKWVQWERTWIALKESGELV